MAAFSSAPVANVPALLRELQLFPLLKQIHALPSLPPLLHGLTFPERLIDPSNLDSSPLSPDHPLLATLQAAIRALEEYQGLSPLLSDVQAIYRGYLDELCSTQVGGGGTTKAPEWAWR